MKQYLDLLKNVKENGKLRQSRSGDVISLFSPSELKFDLREGFPAVTTKKLAFNSVVGELLWFLSGSTSLYDLRMYSGIDDGGWTIWSQDQKRFTESILRTYDRNLINDVESIGLMYGHQWRNYGYKVDQITKLINDIKSNPTSRELMVLNYNPSERDVCALAACHLFFQCYVDDGYLDLKFYMRSNDLFLGAPFNIASYGLLLELLARFTGLKARYLYCSFGDAHIYTKHLEQVELQLSRETYESPKLYISELLDFDNLDDFIIYARAKHFKLIDYKHHPAIKAELLVG